LRDEYFEIVDREGKVIGLASREKCHSNPELIHRAVHVLVVNLKGEIYLQKRSLDKDIQPGKWDSSVGGHLKIGEDFREAAFREMEEELGIKEVELKFMYNYIYKSNRETELVYTYRAFYDGEIRINKEEIEEGRFWKEKEIENSLGKDIFTPNFEEEYQRYLKWKREKIKYKG
jgi:isopentenyl-diphosphate delta-isomerase type 1